MQDFNFDRLRILSHSVLNSLDLVNLEVSVGISFVSVSRMKEILWQFFFQRA